MMDGEAKPGNIRAVIFDYGQVLCHPPTKEAIDRVAGIFNVDHCRFQQLYGQHRGLYDRGDLTATEYWMQFARDAGVRIDSTLVEKLRVYDVEMWNRVNVRMVHWAASIWSQGFKTAILSNMHADMLAYVRQNFDWLKYFTCQSFSCELRQIKPDSAIYEHCLRLLNLAPSTCLFIDDREVNVQAARKLGMHAICFQSVDRLTAELEQSGFHDIG